MGALRHLIHTPFHAQNHSGVSCECLVVLRFFSRAIKAFHFMFVCVADSSIIGTPRPLIRIR